MTVDTDVSAAPSAVKLSDAGSLGDDAISVSVRGLRIRSDTPGAHPASRPLARAHGVPRVLV